MPEDVEHVKREVLQTSHDLSAMVAAETVPPARHAARCRLAWVHPDDLVADNHPGMRLSAAEAREAETLLADALAEEVNNLLMNLHLRTEDLHPIPFDPWERARWQRELPLGIAGKYSNLEAERARYVALCQASARNDWTQILIALTKGPMQPNTTAAGRKAQPLRDTLEKRRTQLRLEAARRLGCTCV